MRLALAIRGVWGGVLLLDPTAVLRVGGGLDSPGVRLATRILGVRHLTEAVVLSGSRDARPRRVIAGIDVVHALSMIAVAAGNPRLRRDALLSVAFSERTCGPLPR